MSSFLIGIISFLYLGCLEPEYVLKQYSKHYHFYYLDLVYYYFTFKQLADAFSQRCGTKQ